MGIEYLITKYIFMDLYEFKKYYFEMNAVNFRY